MNQFFKDHAQWIVILVIAMLGLAVHFGFYQALNSEQDHRLDSLERRMDSKWVEVRDDLDELQRIDRDILTELGELNGTLRGLLDSGRLSIQRGP